MSDAGLLAQAQSLSPATYDSVQSLPGTLQNIIHTKVRKLLLVLLAFINKFLLQVGAGPQVINIQ